MNELPPLDEIVDDYVSHLKDTQDYGGIAALSNFYRRHRKEAVIQHIVNEVESFAKKYIPEPVSFTEVKNGLKSNRNKVIGYSVLGSVGYPVMYAGAAALFLVHQDTSFSEYYIPLAIILTGFGMIGTAVIGIYHAFFEGRALEEKGEQELVAQRMSYVVLPEDELCSVFDEKRDYVVEALGLFDSRQDARDC